MYRAYPTTDPIDWVLHRVHIQHVFETTQVLHAARRVVHRLLEEGVNSHRSGQPHDQEAPRDE